MLRNELSRIEKLIDEQYCLADQSCCARFDTALATEKVLQSACAEVRDVWASVALSQLDNEAMKRYFSYQMQALCELFEKTTGSGMADPGLTNELVQLADYLFGYVNRFIDREMPLPSPFIATKLEELKPSFFILTDQLDRWEIDLSLKDIVISSFAYLFEGETVSGLSFGFLSYVRRFVLELVSICQLAGTRDFNELLLAKLIALNFNDLYFLKYVQNKIRSEAAAMDITARMDLLRIQMAEIAPAGTSLEYGYDLYSPPLRYMLRSWIGEELTFLEMQAEHERKWILSSGYWEKIGLNLSVAQLACLIRVLCSAGVAAGDNLTDIFKACAFHFRTKRQDHISEGSLSNQFYNITQKTAAVVRDLLQKMILAIDSQYFPLWAVIVLVSYVH